MIPPIETRVGLILADDNRFFGRSVLHGWADDTRSPFDLVMTALGVAVDDDVRDRMRMLGLCLTSPDARVWPLKLARILASHGDAAAAFFAAQLVSTGRTMGPGTTGAAATLLQDFVDVGVDALDAGIDAARTRFAGRLPGFGVPFRPADERMLGLRQLLRDRPVSRGRHWQTLERLVARIPVAPNIALGAGALLLDSGVPAHLCGLGVSLLMTHVFLGHAVEATANDACLRALPASVVAYQGPARRAMPETIR